MTPQILLKVTSDKTAPIYPPINNKNFNTFFSLIKLNSEKDTFNVYFTTQQTEDGVTPDTHVPNDHAAIPKFQTKIKCIYTKT